MRFKRILLFNIQFSNLNPLSVLFSQSVNSPTFQEIRLFFFRELGGVLTSLFLWHILNSCARNSLQHYIQQKKKTFILIRTQKSMQLFSAQLLAFFVLWQGFLLIRVSSILIYSIQLAVDIHFNEVNTNHMQQWYYYTIVSLCPVLH